MAEAKKVLIHYYNIDVPMTPATQKITGCAASIRISVTEYRNRNYPNTLASDWETRKEDLRLAFVHDKDSDKPAAPAKWYIEALPAPFVGYGSPDEVAFVLTLAAHYAAKGKLSLTGSPVKAPPANMESDLVAYTKKYIGLDCLGLVANCAIAIFGDSGKYRNPDTNKLGPKGCTGYTLLARQDERIHAASDVGPKMGIIYAVNGQPAKHGVMIDEVTDGGDVWTLHVVESLGEYHKGIPTGPRGSVFEVSKTAKGTIFSVTRKSPFIATQNAFIVKYS